MTPLEVIPLCRTQIHRHTYMLMVCSDQAGNDDSIALVNARATARAHHKITLADKVDKLFSRFWLLLSEDFNQSPTKNPTSFLGVAYYQFWDAYAKLQ